MKWADRVTALVLFILSGVWIYLAVRLPFPIFARVSKMSPGHYPSAVAILLAVLSIVLFAQTFRSKEIDEKRGDQEEAGTRNPKSVQHLITGFALFLGYVILIPFLGFVLASVLFVFFFIFLIGRFNIFVTGAISMGVPALLWTIFAYLLTVPLPKGPWGF